MVTRAETVRIPTTRVGTRTKLRKAIATAVANWARRGQLGSSHMTEMSRYTGGRI